MNKADSCCVERWEAEDSDGISIDYDESIEAFVLTIEGVGETASVFVTHCPWCGTELDPEAEGHEPTEEAHGLVVLGPGAFDRAVDEARATFAPDYVPADAYGFAFDDAGNPRLRSRP